MKKCGTAAPSGARLHQCGPCGVQYVRRESFELDVGCCVQRGTAPPQMGHGASGYNCQYCGKPWPNRMSLAQHICNKHMAESQRDRNREVVGTAPTRQLWTEERGEAFLGIADRVGWLSHSLIASHLGLTVCQVRNYKPPTKRTVAKRASHPEIDVTCPKCHQPPETLGYILNACTPNAGLMRERHNTILQRLVKAVPQEAGDKFVEQKIKDSPGDQQKVATIVDVTILYEGEAGSFDTARAEKHRKYYPLTEWLSNKRFTVSCHAFIMGALGAWDPTGHNPASRL